MSLNDSSKILLIGITARGFIKLIKIHFIIGLLEFIIFQYFSFAISILQIL